MSKKTNKPDGIGETKKESIKTERLSSLFSTQRDLNLLNNAKTNQRAQTNKKSYAPNLNVARNKNTEKVSESSRENNKSERGKNARGRGGRNNVNNNNKRNNLVQTVGFLSEGIASAPIFRKSNDHYGGSSRDNTADTLQRPRIVRRDTKPDKSELDAEQRTLVNLLGDGEEDELNLDDDDSKTSAEEFLPIKICNPNKRRIGTISKKSETEMKIKIEPVDDSIEVDSSENSLTNGSIAIKNEPGIEIKSEEFHRMDKLFDATPNDFMLFQLPDTLPGRAPDATETGETSTKSESPNLCNLEHLEEGLIGKLVRYKSGKTKLMLGDTLYDVDLGLKSDFQQNAVTVNTNSTERSASVYSLGQINAKFNVTPDWLHLFHKMTP